MSEQELAVRPQGFVKEATVPLMALLGKYRSQIVEILPKHLSPERVLKLIVGELNRTPALLNCSAMSVVNCCLHAASLGVEIRPRSAYILPYGNVATLLFDYRSRIDLALRSGLVEDIEARLVYEGDEFSIQYGTDPKMTHIPKFETETVVLGYALCWMKNVKRPHVEVMTKVQMDAIRNKSKARSATAWTQHTDQMYRKTLIHRLANYIPQSPEMNAAQDIDDRADMGKPLDALIDVEPEFDRPMVPAGDEEIERRIAEMEATGADPEDIRIERLRLDGIRANKAAAAKKDEAKQRKAEAKKPAVRTFDDFPDCLAVNDEQIYVDNVLYRRTEENTGWQRAVAP